MADQVQILGLAPRREPQTLAERASARLGELESEYEKGKGMLLQLDEQRQAIARSLTRIEGAMTVLRADLGIHRPDEQAAQ